MGWLLLLPLLIGFGLTYWVGLFFAMIGGIWRLLGVLFSLAIGGACVYGGHALGFEGYQEWQGSELHQTTWPAAGVIGMIIGGLSILTGLVVSTFPPSDRDLQSLLAEEEDLYCSKCGDRLTEGICRRCRNENIQRKSDGLDREDVYCCKCGTKLVIEGFLCQVCDNSFFKHFKLCPKCSLYTPLNKKLCVYCRAELKEGGCPPQRFSPR